MKPATNTNLIEIVDDLIARHPRAQLGIVLKSGGTAEGVAEKVSSEPPIYKLTMKSGKQRTEGGKVFDGRLDCWIDGWDISKVQLMMRVDKPEDLEIATGGVIPSDVKLTLS